MARKKISQLPAASGLTTADLVPVVQGGATRKATWAQALDLVFAGLGHILPIARGGTGQASAGDALNALLPAQATHAGQFLQTDGADASWAAGGGVTGVTSTGGSCTVTPVGTVRNVEINLAHHNGFTAPLDVDFTPVANRYRMFLGAAATDWAISAQNITTGGSVFLCADTTQLLVIGPGSAESVSLCNGTNALTVNAGNAHFAGQVRIIGNVGVFGAAAVGQQASGGALVDATGGAVAGTLNAVAGTGDDATVNGNFASLMAKVETIRAGLAVFGWFS